MNIICDTAIIVNFLKINRIDLLDRSSHTFLVSDHVQQEIALDYPAQLKRFQKALKKSIIQKIPGEDSEEFDLFAALFKTGQLSVCESATLAAAAYRGYSLATDDSQVIDQAELLMAPNRILRTQNIVVALINENLLTDESADQLLDAWATNLRFKHPTFETLFPEDSLLQETSLQWGIFPLILKSG